MIGAVGLFVSGLPTAAMNIIGLDWRFQRFDADFHRMACIAGFVRFHARIWTTPSNTEIRWSSFPIVAEDDGPRRDHPKTKTPRNNNCSHCCVSFLQHFFASHKRFTNMYLTRSEYDRGVNTFSPEGRLFQVSSVFLVCFHWHDHKRLLWAIPHALSSLF